jgi:hypothetical protein
VIEACDRVLQLFLQILRNHTSTPHARTQIARPSADTKKTHKLTHANRTTHQLHLSHACGPLKRKPTGLDAKLSQSTQWRQAFCLMALRCPHHAGLTDSYCNPTASRRTLAHARTPRSRQRRERLNLVGVWTRSYFLWRPSLHLFACHQ